MIILAIRLQIKVIVLWSLIVIKLLKNKLLDSLLKYF